MKPEIITVGPSRTHTLAAAAISEARGQPHIIFELARKRALDLNAGMCGKVKAGERATWRGVLRANQNQTRGHWFREFVAGPL